ncbi:putative ABC transport system permease protein [Roseiarcus fermentans]|uniref:Putative ABC transport system permease protein n=1 Tax=Roseiarcus fermentans TaxID=1473586 RepID=A0A366F405_9HYPH|nr:FtsX-like permease family protein [Roseiarcus fermentans]RBP08710.1 putative ABC transport system permease protein [Roseiarcus fermentans]
MNGVPAPPVPQTLALLRFALRDLRGGLAGLWIFFVCIALGVTAIVGVESLAGALNHGLARQGRVLLGGDASFSLIHRQLTPEERAFLARSGTLSTVATLRGMARAASGDAALVEVKAVEPSWPSLGEATFAPPIAPAEALRETNGVFGAAAEEALLARLNLAVGDTFHLGEATFVLRAVVASEPDRLAVGVGFGPRLLISQAALEATRLVQPGSLTRWTTRIVMDGPHGAPDEAAVRAFVAAANTAFPEAGWETRSRLAVSPDFSRSVDRFAEFLTLAGLLSLVVGGVGVANAAQGFVERKRATLAILKAIGATGTGVVAIAAVEFLIVALAGALAGAAAGAAIPFAVAALLANIIPVPLEPSVEVRVVGLGLAYGLLTALAFALPPLSRAHDLPVTTLIRDLAEERQGFPRARYLAVAGLAAAALVALAVLTSPQPTIALAVAGATLAAFVVLRLVALGLALAARRAPVKRPVELRMALAAIHRPGALTPSIVLSLGLGLAALTSLGLIDFNMRNELRETLPGVTPSFFFLDLRGAEAPRFLDFLKREAPGAKVSETPMMRGRFVTLAGTPAAKVKASEKVAWALEGDRGVTFAATPPEGSEVVAGQWWAKDYAGPPLVSMERDVAEGLGVKVGDAVTVNVLGRDITATVANLRKVNWRSYAINFVLVYSPNTFRGAPFSELVSAALPAGGAPETEIALLRATARDFPSVVSVRVHDALETIEGLVAKLALAIRAATGVALTTSVLVLAGALAANRRARLADATILKILGATRTRLSGMFLIEYAILGSATAAFGIAAGTLIAWAVVTRILFAEFVFDWTSALAAAGGGLAFTVILGMIGAWRILGTAPAAFLREL